MKTLLHVGCGNLNKSNLKGFDNENWKEVRLDINQDVNPDIVTTLTDLSMVDTGTFDAIYSAYNIDHIYPHEVPKTLKEFYRVLNQDGIVVIRCPDIQRVCEYVAEDKLLDVLYESPSGPISAIDILFGNRKSIAQGNPYMAKKGGFTYSVLNTVFGEAGFQARYGGRIKNSWELALVAFKQKKPEEEIKRMADPFFL
jgi:SAM-dependent methyltransferase